MEKTIIISDTQSESRAQGITDVSKCCEDYLKYASKDNATPNSYSNFEMYDYTLSNVEVIPTETSFVNDDVKMLLSSTTVLENNSSIEQSRTENFSTNHEETYTYSTTEGYKIGAGIKSTTKAKVKVDFLMAGSELEQSLELSFTSEYNHSSTETTSTKESRSWGISQPIKVPPYSKIICTQYIMGGTVNVPVKLNATLRGNHYIPMASDTHLAGIQYTPVGAGYKVLSVMAANYLENDWPGKPSGVFNPSSTPHAIDLVGVGKNIITAGYYSYVKFEELPLDGKSSKASKVYYSDIMLADGTTIPFSKNFLIK